MKKKKPELNKYEKAMMGSLSVIKALGVAVVLMNTFMPLVSSKTDESLGIWSWVLICLLQIIVLIFHGWGFLGATSYLMHQPVLMAQVLALRTIQIVLFTYLFSINWVPMGIVLFLDVIFLTMLLLDKSSYRYGKEPAPIRRK